MCCPMCGSGASEQRLAFLKTPGSVPGGVMNMEAGGDYCTAKSFRCEREETEGS